MRTSEEMSPSVLQLDFWERMMRIIDAIVSFRPGRGTEFPVTQGRKSRRPLRRPPRHGHDGDTCRHAPQRVLGARAKKRCAACATCSSASASAAMSAPVGVAAPLRAGARPALTADTGSGSRALPADRTGPAYSPLVAKSGMPLQLLHGYSTQLETGLPPQQQPIFPTCPQQEGASPPEAVAAVPV